MKVTFIKPNIGRKKGKVYVDGGRMEPLPFARLAAMTPPDVELALFDDRMEPIPYDAPTDLAAVNVDAFTARRAYEISASFRRRGVPVVLGGFHPSLIPEESLEHADAVCVGEAEGIWPQIVEDARRGRLGGLYRAGGRASLSGLTYRREIFRGKGYLRLALVEFGRGCVNRCNFCAVGSFFDRTYTHRPVDEVVEEVRTLRSRPVFFVDDNIVANREAAKALLEKLVPLGIRWVGQASVDFLEDPELARLMVQSGCAGLVVGFESIVRENLSQMDKNPNLAHADWRAAIRTLRTWGLQVWAAFLLGYDHDDAESIEATWRFARKNRFTFAAFNNLMPYPGTPVYEELRAQGRLLYDKWWLDPDYRFGHASLRHPRMSPEEFTEAVRGARYRFNSPGSILYRMFDPKTGMRNPLRAAIHLWYNLIFRREMLKKQDMKFGYT
jgi:radical SAM superfamily enzyme YgiQ (UPF0313 family)